MGILSAPLSPKLDWNLANPLWAATLNPVIANALLQGKVITNFVLAIGNNVINHELNRLQIGWYIVDQNAFSSIYRSKPFNSQNLVLNSSAVVTISLWVF